MYEVVFFAPKIINFTENYKYVLFERFDAKEYTERKYPDKFGNFLKLVKKM